MKKLLTILFIFLAACSAQVPVAEPTAVSPTAEPVTVPQEAVAPETAVPVEGAYPAKPVAEPLPADIPPGAYPAAGESESVWIIRPEGVQCETSDAPTGEKGLQYAVESLMAAGVNVQSWELTEMMVTAVCGAPTSTHYLMQIPASELDKAIALGWTEQ